MDTVSTTFTGGDKLNEIVARYPETLEIFGQFGLDTCCGGALPLATAAEHHGLPLKTLIEALQARVDQTAR
jgi:iron-sulfur cluster repair protein YtfE (RIC family)